MIQILKFHIYDAGGNGTFMYLATQILNLVKQKIRTVSISSCPRPTNYIVWSANINDMYAPNSSYSWLLFKARNLHPDVRWTWNWKLKALEKNKDVYLAIIS